jgi:hypothetical protein
MPSISNYVHSLASNSLWYVRTLLLEVCNTPRRIRMLRRKKRDPLDLGPLYEECPSGELVPCKATIARTQYVEFLLARYPWASDVDVLLALDGWDKGTELVRHTLDTSKMDASVARDQYPLALAQ